MNLTLEVLADLLRKARGDGNKKEAIQELQNALRDAFKHFEKSKTEDLEEKRKLQFQGIIPLKELVNLSNQFGFPLPTGVKVYDIDESLELEGYDTSPSSRSDTFKPVEDAKVKPFDCSIVPPEEFGETSPVDVPPNAYQQILQKMSEEEEEFDGDKEFDDVREGDEDWEEPKYNFENIVTQPIYYDRNAFKINALQFIHSFGYDSYRRQNLCVIDEDTFVYLSGNYIHVYDVPTGSFTYIRSIGGSGLGHCAKHPSEPIFAVGERGVQPVIVIYSCPTLKILRILRGAGDCGINSVCFSANGKWLLSQASLPDSSLTVWNWNRERIVLKQRSVGKDIWKAEYNPFEVGGIITTGLEHITFWKLIRTFTGLKLIPTPGKWGSRTFCDTNSFCALPEGMVIGSNANNNLFVWEREAITMEIHRRNNRSLHDEGIVYLEFKEKYDEIFTVGLEGKYKVWDFTRLGHAKLKDMEHLEIQATFQRTIKEDLDIARPQSFQKTKQNDPDSEMYYMQDRKGGIWLIELAVKEKLAESKRVFYGHDGPIVDIAPSPAGYYIASIGQEGRLHVYNSKFNKLVLKLRLSVPGTSLLWLPLDIDKTGSLLVIGGCDGTIRLAVLSIRAREVYTDESDDKYVNIIQVFKPHSEAITVLSVDPHRQDEHIVVSGSNDCRIFIYRLRKYKQEFLRLCPIGFVLLPGPVYSLTWNKNKESFLATSLNGTISEVIIPEDIPNPPTNSFEIKLPLRICKFKSVKSEVEQNSAIQRNMMRKEKHKLLQEKKRAYEIQLLENRRQKLKELDETAREILIHEAEEKIRLQKEKQLLKKQKEDASRDQEKLLKEYFLYRSPSPSDDSGGSVSTTEDIFTKKSVLSDLSIDSRISYEKASNELLRDLQDSVEERKAKRGIVVQESAHDIEIVKKKETTIKEVSEKIEEIKTMHQEEKDSEHKAKKPTADKIILNELMKILDEEVNFDDLEAVSEDEEIPPRHYSSGPVPIYFADYINEDCIWVSPGGYDAGYIYEYQLGANEPYKCSPILEFENIEMTCFLYINGGYIIVGQGNGYVKVININPDNHTDFSNYWIYGMHDNINGKIKKIAITYDSRFVYSIGEDSNIFYYGVNLINTKFKEKRNLPQLMLPPSELKIDDFVPPEELSLEDSVKQAEKDWLLDFKTDTKIILQEKLENLANKFEILFALNGGLPESQRLPLDYFIINEEYYTKSLQSLLDKKKQKTEELEHDVEKAKIIRNQIYNYFINPIKTHKIYLYGHSFYCKVTTFFQAKLTVPFLMAEKEVDNIMLAILKKGRADYEHSFAIEHQPAVAKKKYKKKDLEFRPFVPGEDKMLADMPRFQKSLYTRIIQRRKRRKILQNLLRIFKDQSVDKKREFLENMMYKAKPPKDLTYRLKCDPLYKITQNITKERKFYQLVTTKRKIYDLMSHFNMLALKAREMKSQAAALSSSCYYDLKNITCEFQNVIWPLLPQKVDIFEPLEFPENMYMDNPPEFSHERKISSKHKNKLFYQLYEINKTFPIDMTTIEFGGPDGKSDSEYTPWEREFILERKHYLMAEFLKKKYLVDELLERYDNEIKKLTFMKVEYEVKISYLKICFLKYFEELQVIRIFQLMEDNIDSKCSIFIKQKHIQILRINIRKKRIKKCTFDIVRCFHRCQMIATRFMKEIRNNPTSIKRFIMKFFNKTWAHELKKSELGDDDDIPEEEVKSSSSDDMDSGPPEPDEDEIDSDDIDRLVAEQQEDFIEVSKADAEQECGKELFDYTLETREKRYTYERRITQRKLEIKSYNDQIKTIRDKVLMIQSIIAMYQVKKSLVLEEKHKQLSTIRTIVVLEASQMQHFNAQTNTFPPMKETILFPLYTLKNLEAKKRKLTNKILTVELDKKETLKHVQRLRLDIAYLKKKLQSVKDRITMEKINKYGYDINLPRMEETILRRIIKDYKYDTFPFHMKFHADITQLQKELQRVKRSAAEQIKQNTFEQLQYGALLEQKRQYQEIMRKIENKNKVQYLSLEEIQIDTEKLKNLLQIQENMKETLKSAMSEIRFPKAPLLRESVIKVKQKMIDEMLDKIAYESGTETEDSYGENQKKKRRNKQQKKVKEPLDGAFQSFDSEEELSISKTEHHKKYKMVNDSNEDDSPLDMTSDEEMIDHNLESEEENFQKVKDDTDESYYGD